jgi:iron complex transport system substrate-binding protein
MKCIRNHLFTALISLALTACGNPRAEFAIELNETAAGRVVTHRFGSTTVPQKPKRVIALGEEGMLADLIDANIAPVGSSASLPESMPGFTASELAGVVVFNSTQPNLEQIAALKPDLIIGAGFFVEQIGYEKLNAIAPTVSIDIADWRAEYQALLGIVGASDVGRRKLADFDAALQTQKTQMSAVPRIVSVGSVYPGPSPAVWVDGPTAAPQLLLDLGVALTPTVQDAQPLGVKSGRAFFSPERLDLWSADTLILAQSGAVDGERGALAAIKANPLWSTLPAVRAGRVYEIDRFAYPGLRGRRKLLNELVSMLRK